MNKVEIPPHLLTPQPAEDALKAIGFQPYDLGLERSWGSMRFTACPWLGCWMVLGSWATKRAIGMPEFRIPPLLQPIDLLAAIYREWASARFTVPTPEDLLWGKAHAENKKHLASLIPPLPTLWADREFLRYCLSYVERLNDWADTDYDITFTHTAGQLKIAARQTEVFCPARGQWVGSSIVSAKEFFRRIPKRFMGDVVTVSAKVDRLVIESHHIKARLVDEESTESAPAQ